MKQKKKKGLLTVLLTAILLLALAGCAEDEPEFRRGYWWEHPGEGGSYAEDAGFDWWNALDENWTQDDWELTEDGLWIIYDEETACYYLYDEESGEYGAIDPENEELYFLDMDTGEWVSAE